jgi:FMN phosphatase YigB (HAD superfamily)
VTHALIFDIDGTLLDSSTQDEDIYKQAVDEVIGPASFRANLHDYEHVTDTGILLQILEDNGLLPREDLIRRIKSAFFARIGDYVAAAGPFREIPGAKAMIRRYRGSAGHSVAIATGGWRESARIKLQTAGFELDGIPLATSDDAVDRTEIMRIALQSTGSACSAVTYFGDGPWDRLACERLGWRFCAVGPALNGILSFDDARLEIEA